MISVIVPFHDNGVKLGRCLESIKMQTFTDYEVIMIDNGSTDKRTIDIARDFAKGRKFQYIPIKYQSYADATLYGIHKATGEYVTVVDADDFLNIYALQVYYYGMIGTCVDIIISDYTYIKKASSPLTDNTKEPEAIDVKKLDKYKAMDKTCDSFPHNYIRFNSIWGKLYKKELFADIEFEDDVLLGAAVIPMIIWRCDEIGIVDFKAYMGTEKQEPIMDERFLKAYKNRIVFLNEYKDEIEDSWLSFAYSQLAAALLKTENPRADYIKKIYDMYALTFPLSLREEIEKFLEKGS